MNKDDLDNKLDAFLDGEKKFLDDLEKIDVEKNWQAFLEKTGNAHEQRPVQKTIWKPGSRWMAVAASLVILLTVSLVLLFTSRTGISSEVEIATSDRSSEITLPDGSMVWLNTRSNFHYTEHRSGNRLATLNGEAYFEVQQLEKKPFTIHVGEAVVNVIGTSFNIKKSGEGKVTVRVLSGKVRFNEKANPSNEIILSKGNMGVYQPGTSSISLSDFETTNFLSWKTDTLTFSNTPLDSVFEQLEQHYDRTIIVSDTSICSNNLTTTCTAQEIEEILEEIGMLFDLEYEMKDREITIKRK